MPAYVIANIDVKDPVRHEDYKKMSPTSIQQHGGRFVARGGKCDVLEGSWTPKRLRSSSFQTPHAREWWASTEYAPAKALRQATSTGDMVVIEGV